MAHDARDSSPMRYNHMSPEGTDDRLATSSNPRRHDYDHDHASYDQRDRHHDFEDRDVRDDAKHDHHASDREPDRARDERRYRDDDRPHYDHERVRDSPTHDLDRPRRQSDRYERDDHQPAHQDDDIDDRDDRHDRNDRDERTRRDDRGDRDGRDTHPDHDDRHDRNEPLENDQRDDAQRDEGKDRIADLDASIEPSRSDRPDPSHSDPSASAMDAGQSHEHHPPSDHLDTAPGDHSDHPSGDQDRTLVNLFVRNVAKHVMEHQLIDLFSKFGTVDSAVVVRDPHSKECRGFGFVKMVTDRDAQQAIDALHEFEFEGRHISVERAKRNGPHTRTPGTYLGLDRRIRDRYAGMKRSRELAYAYGAPYPPPPPHPHYPPYHRPRFYDHPPRRYDHRPMAAHPMHPPQHDYHRHPPHAGPRYHEVRDPDERERVRRRHDPEASRHSPRDPARPHRLDGREPPVPRESAEDEI